MAFCVLANGQWDDQIAYKILNYDGAIKPRMTLCHNRATLIEYPWSRHLTARLKMTITTVSLIIQSYFLFAINVGFKLTTASLFKVANSSNKKKLLKIYLWMEIVSWMISMNSDVVIQDVLIFYANCDFIHSLNHLLEFQ